VPETVDERGALLAERVRLASIVRVRVAEGDQRVTLMLSTNVTVAV
jgi:hypothetical protein